MQLMGTIEPNLKTLIYPPAEELSEILVWMTMEVTVPPQQWKFPETGEPGISEVV